MKHDPDQMFRLARIHASCTGAAPLRPKSARCQPHLSHSLSVSIVASKSRHPVAAIASQIAGFKFNTAHPKTPKHDRPSRSCPVATPHPPMHAQREHSNALNRSKIFVWYNPRVENHVRIRRTFVHHPNAKPGIPTEAIRRLFFRVRVPSERVGSHSGGDSLRSIHENRCHPE